MPAILPADSAKPLSEAELRSIVARHLPAWQQACDTDEGDSIALHVASFGTSTHELFLFACAIKYAAVKGKHVHVASGTGRMRRQPEAILPSVALGLVYREALPGTRKTPIRSPSSKRTMRKK